MEKKEMNNKSVAKKVFDVVSTVVIVLYLVFSLVISFSIFASLGSEAGVPSLFGYSLMNVITDSMEGDRVDSFNQGDLVICEGTDKAFSLEVDDIIAFRSTVYIDNEQEQEIIKIHRIVEINDEGNYITCGDSSPDLDGDGNPDPDDIPVSPMRVLGVYTGKRIPGGGNVFNFITSSNGIMICLVVPMAVFFIYALFKFIKAMIDYKMSKTVPADGELSEEQKQKAIEEYLAKQAAEANKDENNTDNTSEE